KVLNCDNYVYLDEIDNYEFKKISKYNKSKVLYNKITYDFKLVNELIDKQDLLSATAVLRTLYENIIYIIAKSYNINIKVTLDTAPRDLRKVLEDNCSDIFTDYFEKEDFNEIYKHLCKIVHPCSMKELLSYMSATIKYKNYLLTNLKYTVLVIEYMYLNFLNKKVGNGESKFDLNFIKLSTYVNVVNVNYFMIDIKDNKSFTKRYFYYDTNNKYVTNNQGKLKEVYETLINKKRLIQTDKKELTKELDILIKELDIQIKESKYNE
ncbi:MAG: hypothetical protein PHR09_01560, partial [Bacilli bacterium]|nr:hypothetical protein [Bacilli bacterium]